MARNEVLSKLLEKDEDLRITEELISIHAINPFINHCSSARGVMLSSHFSQSLTLNNGEERIIQTGLEKQFGDNTFSKKAEEDMRVIKVIDRYKSIDYNGVDKVVEKLVIVENLETGEIDYIDIPYCNKMHQYFGFKYKVDEDLVNTLRPNDILPKNTVLADSPSVGENKGYKYGLNGNLCLINLPEATEDGIIISRSFAEKLNYSIFETRVVEFGSNSFPLNIYGDENNYKPFPEIGELVNEDSIIMALREMVGNNDTKVKSKKPESFLAPALTSINDVKDFNPIFDKVVYAKAPGEDKVVNGYKVNYGRIVDIKAYGSPRSKKLPYSGTSDIVNKYINGLRSFYQDILNVYESLSTYKFRTNNKERTIKLSEKFHRLIIEAYSIVNPDNDNIIYKARNELLDTYRIEFTIEYVCGVTVGHKISDANGCRS